MVSRAEVYKVLDGERDYQQQRWNMETTITGGRHTVDEYLLYIQDYLTEAIHVASRNPSPQSTKLSLDILRKVTAMGIAAMEENGVVYRV